MFDICRDCRGCFEGTSLRPQPTLHDQGKWDRDILAELGGKVEYKLT
jgi:hypothetical protein